MSSSLPYPARALKREVINAYGLSTMVLAEHRARDRDAFLEMQAHPPHQGPASSQLRARPSPSPGAGSPKDDIGHGPMVTSLAGTSKRAGQTRNCARLVNNAGCRRDHARGSGPRRRPGTAAPVVCRSRCAQ
jgi:hypothetical protein